MPKKNTTEFRTIYQIFKSLHQEVIALARKKNETTISKAKVEFINIRLKDVKDLLANEPESKYLEILDEETLPQYSDVTLVMSQYEAGLKNYFKRHHNNISDMEYLDE